ncbi:HIT family protein [Nanoarchaeota archaeon]
MAQQQMTDEQRKELQEKLSKMSPEELKEFQKKQCIFCQIISGQVESQKVYEDEKHVAVLDINPANVGHILLLPKEHYSILPQMKDEEVSQMFTVAKHLSQVLLKALKAQGTNIFVANGMVAGQRAQHFMIHVVPRFEADKVIGFQIPQKEVTESDLKKLREILANKINELMDIKKKVVVEQPQEEPEVKEEPEKVVEEEKPDKFITSAKAKRFHIESCPFAQKIKDDKRILLDLEEVSKSREPCDCTGLRKKETKPKKESAKKTPKKKTTGKKTKQKEESSLDDIAELFK